MRCNSAATPFAPTCRAVDLCGIFLAQDASGKDACALGQVTRNVTFGFPSATLVMELLGTGRFAVHRDVKITVCSSGQRQVKVVVLAIDMHEQPLPMHARGTNGKF